MPIWCARGACLAHPQRVRCASSLLAVRIWLSRGACMVRVWLARGARAMRVWLTHGARAMRVWLAYGAPAVRVWLTRGLLTWLLEFEPPDLQDFPTFILGFHRCKAYP